MCGVRLVSSDSVSEAPITSQQQKGSNWLYKAELSALAVRLGHKIQDVPSLAKALEQESHLKTVPKRGAVTKQMVKPNRLSVLGKSTMMHYVNEYLYSAYPLLDGSMLLDLANSITNQAALIKLANHFGVTDLIKATVDVALPENSTVISQSFFGVLGAIYQDQGPKSTKKLVHEIVIPQLSGKDLEEVVKLQHPRFMLSGILHKQNKPRPVARLIRESGRATHFPSFVVGIFSGENCLGEGTGTSLRRAEHEAMVSALHTYFQKELSAAALPSDHEEFFTEEELKEKVVKTSC